MLNNIFEILGVKNIESAIYRAKKIQQDVFLYGHASQYNDKEFFASEWMIDFELAQEKESVLEKPSIYEYM